MEEKQKQKPFDGAAWFDRQVQRRTRAALTARGSKAKAKSPEYRTEYARQLKLFRAERAEVKQKKREKHLARLARQSNSGETHSQARRASSPKGGANEAGILL